MTATSSSSSPAMPNPSALSSLIAASASPNPLSASTIQILHNLQHQHLWTSLKAHDIPIPSSTPSTADEASSTLFLISGIPPHHVYIHPDEQLYMLQKGLREDDVELERMFVLPTVHGQSWTLRKLAAVFDSLPDTAEEEALGSSVDDGEERAGSEDGEKAAKLAAYYEYRQKARQTGEWGTKRLLLAMVDRSMGGDGTVVYYVVHEGAVKPRQN
ncbi:hypothetical protein P170DRAFT_428058 [Aspergillus steynii IBT 23096]|uniref:tRNA-splicing endonuclease subunit Sen15 domain-containing protein n=1 Tax=Aspergillus steynii IBT 23096 TaxID=1392250 RepID=A0A2I2G1M2_9EURO|nr:uncharacterized protein P170DRAFT_428058 [Aspergillus steynii IBT 23096]PLB46768.1 hypothetical protein P170DRAFT_428058 [Aspergillus steynii IBT 23096]